MGKLQTIYVVTILLLASVSGAGLGSVSAAGNADGGGANSFGHLVSTFVQGLEKSGNANVGFRVATFVLSNNPAADVIPEHAGPPADGVTGQPDRAGAGNSIAGPPDHAGAVNSMAGPPEDAGPPGETQRGPPEDAGPEDTGPPSDAGPPGDDDRGPPSDAGPPGESADDETTTPTETDDDTATAAAGSANDGGGPPSDRGGPPDDAGPPS